MKQTIERVWTQHRATLLRLGKFGLVGGSGVLVNMGIFALALMWLQAELAGALAVVISILTNFLLNDAWTWGDRRSGGLRGGLVRLAKYALVAGIAGVVQLGVLWLLSNPMGFNPYLSNLAGIAAGVVINFGVNNVWTFRQRGDTPVGPSEGGDAGTLERVGPEIHGRIG